MNTPVESKKTTAEAWHRICLISDAVTMGPLLGALHCAGIFQRIVTPGDAPSINRLADEFSIPRGFLHWSAALLELQGLVTRTPASENTGNTDFVVHPTPAGSALAPYLSQFADAGQMIHTARRVHAGEWSVLKSFRFPQEPFPGLPPPIAERMAYWQSGPLPAVLLHKIEQSGLIELKHMILPLQYAVCYLDTISVIPEIFSDAHSQPAIVTDGETEERHVDRELDVKLSGNVYIKNCRTPFLDIIMPLFDNDKLEEQPSAIVDTGAGDASMLIDLYRAIAEKTERGRNIGNYPLLMIAAEYNKVARDIAERRLKEAGVPGFVIFGDIADPAAISRELRARGLQPENILHVSKSVFHNRRHEKPSDLDGFELWKTNSQRVFIGENGDYISARQAEWNLVECLRRWREYCGKHGIVVIEAHGVEYSLAANRVGTHVLTTQEATHGLSRQMLLPVEAHRRALRHAGFQPLAQKDLGVALLGQALMSIDHWIPG